MNIKLILILIMVSFTMIGQTSCSSSSKQNPDLSTTRDSAIFTIIPFKDYPSIFENSQQAFLSESDFPIIENMLIKCLEEYNLEQEKINVDTNLKSTAFNADKKNYIIDLKSYKRQYIVVTN